MIPVDQTKFGKGEGNCYQACLASILHASIDEIPRFDEAEERGGYWLTAANRWANDIGLHIIVVREIDWVSWSRYPGYYICGGPAERGLGHACVYHKGELAHDPHPSRAGLLSVDEWHIIVPCDMAVTTTPFASYVDGHLHGQREAFGLPELEGTMNVYPPGSRECYEWERGFSDGQNYAKESKNLGST